MKFSLPAVAFGLSLLGAGDAAKIEIRSTTGPGLIPVSSTAYIGDDGKTYPLGGSFSDGCRKTGYNWIKEICIDDKKGRAHIIYSGGTKKCFKRTRSWSYLCGGSESCHAGVCNRCWEYDYTVVKCTW
ncbi:hypothetical protein NCS52_01292000 [Fusarium sp. LHS14.1]|nr:hypothetical protein NCS52_01292000 [Fusarium sp. LHS14.1]